MAKEMSGQIDHIPNLVQQPRSPSAAKRRTDYSNFFSPQSSSNPDISTPESTGSKDTSSVALASADCLDGKMEDVHDDHLVSSNHCENETEAMSESFPQASLSGQCTSRDEEIGEDGQKSRLTPRNLRVSESQQSCRTTPATHKNGHQSSSDERVDDLNGSDDHKSSGSGTNQSKSDSEESGRGKRKRKPKIPFDSSSMKSTKKLRRYKIMRFLGLTPPTGSPFMLSN
ncbi:hypothetical protein Dimus_007091 [Dionaea muscipula]